MDDAQLRLHLRRGDAAHLAPDAHRGARRGVPPRLSLGGVARLGPESGVRRVDDSAPARHVKAHDLLSVAHARTESPRAAFAMILRYRSSTNVELMPVENV